MMFLCFSSSSLRVTEAEGLEWLFLLLLDRLLCLGLLRLSVSRPLCRGGELEGDTLRACAAYWNVLECADERPDGFLRSLRLPLRPPAPSELLVSNRTGLRRLRRSLGSELSLLFRLLRSLRLPCDLLSDLRLLLLRSPPPSSLDSSSESAGQTRSVTPVFVRASSSTILLTSCSGKPFIFAKS